MSPKETPEWTGYSSIPSSHERPGQPPLVFVCPAGLFLQWGGAWGLSGLNSLTCRPQPRLQLAQLVPPVTTWLDLEAGDEERNLCVSELWPFSLEGGRHGKDLMRSLHFTFFLGSVAFVCFVWPGRGKTPWSYILCVCGAGECLPVCTFSSTFWNLPGWPGAWSCRRRAGMKFRVRWWSVWWMAVAKLGAGTGHSGVGSSW